MKKKNGNIDNKEIEKDNTKEIENKGMDKDSLEEILKFAYKKYDEEGVLRTNVRTKASIMMVLNLTLLTTFSKTLFEIGFNNNVSYILFVAISISLLFVSFWIAADIYSGSNYGSTIMDKLDNEAAVTKIEDLKKDNIEYVKNFIIEELISANRTSRKTNSKKEKQFVKSIYFFCAGLGIIILLTLFGTWQKVESSNKENVNATSAMCCIKSNDKNRDSISPQKITVKDSSTKKVNKNIPKPLKSDRNESIVK